VKREFLDKLASGVELRPAGEARTDSGLLLKPPYLPKYKLELFGTQFYLTAPSKNPAVRFFVAYVQNRSDRIHPRIFYKDLSLVWRVGSHLVATEDEFWIGKGLVDVRVQDGYEHLNSRESTTDLPLELQTAFEALNHRQRRVATDEEALYLVLRNAPPGRIEPYRDFVAPLEGAPRINGNRPVARFRHPGKPSSLRFVRGFEPDFRRGLIEQARSSSRLYGGPIRRYRLLSVNRRIQYLFFAAPRHVWIVPPQATTTELSSYGVRTTHVIADEDLFVPGYEYHYMDEQQPPQLVSQIPVGYAGPQADFDPTRADASRWLEALPVVRRFRLEQRRRRPVRLVVDRGRGDDLHPLAVQLDERQLAVEVEHDVAVADPQEVGFGEAALLPDLAAVRERGGLHEGGRAARRGVDELVVPHGVGVGDLGLVALPDLAPLVAGRGRVDQDRADLGRRDEDAAARVDDGRGEDRAPVVLVLV
jgi:hypothetical protein